MTALLEPFLYEYMRNAIGMSALVGGLCAYLSCYLMLKGWSLIGDALSHAIVPGVVVAYMLRIPLLFGAFVASGLAVAALLLLDQRRGLKSDTVLGLVFIALFGLGLFLVSISPIPVDVQLLVKGNILSISASAAWQLVAVTGVTLLVLGSRQKDLLLVFFDASQARAQGLSPTRLRLLFFALLAAACVAAMQTVGAFLVVALVITPGATAYLLTNRFARLVQIALALGIGSGALGAYLSYFMNGATGGLIVCLQTGIFVVVFLLAPQHGWLAQRRARLRSAEVSPDP